MPYPTDMEWWLDVARQMMPTNLCHHGSLARSCEVCDLERQVAELHIVLQRAWSVIDPNAHEELCGAIQEALDGGCPTVCHLEEENVALTAERDHYKAMAQRDGRIIQHLMRLLREAKGDKV